MRDAHELHDAGSISPNPALQGAPVLSGQMRALRGWWADVGAARAVFYIHVQLMACLAGESDNFYAAKLRPGRL